MTYRKKNNALSFIIFIWHLSFFFTVSIEAEEIAPIFSGEADMMASPAADFSPAAQQSELAKQPQMNASSADTLNYPQEKIGIQGNWQKKRAWLTQAHDLMNKEIVPLIEKIYAARNNFNQQFNMVDQALDDFYKEMGFEQGKLQELFKSIDRYLDKKRQEQLAELLTSKDNLSLSDREYALKTEEVETTVKNLHARLEQLRLDMKSIEDIDNSLAMRLKKLDTEIENATQEETTARTILDTLWHIIDDRKARELFYELQNKSFEKIKSIESYVSNDLLNDFSAVIATAQNQIDRVSKEYTQLEKDGIVIKDRSTRVKKIKEEKNKNKEEEKKALEEAAILRVKQEQKIPKKAPESSWYERITFFFSYLWESCLTLFKAAPPVKKTKPLAADPQSNLTPPAPKPFDQRKSKEEEPLPPLPEIPLS